MTQDAELPRITPNSVAVGQDLGVMEHLFTLDDVVKYASLADDNSSCFRPQGSLPIRLPPTMLSTVGLSLLRQSFQAGAVILAEQEEIYLQPAWTGQRLITRGKVSNKGQRRDRDFIEIETATYDEAGKELMRRRSTLYLTVEKSTVEESA